MTQLIRFHFKSWSLFWTTFYIACQFIVSKKNIFIRQPLHCHTIMCKTAVLWISQTTCWDIHVFIFMKIASKHHFWQKLYDSIQLAIWNLFISLWMETINKLGEKKHFLKEKVSSEIHKRWIGMVIMNTLRVKLVS